MSPTKLQTLTTAATLAVIAGSLSLSSVSVAPFSSNGNQDLGRCGQNQSTLGGGVQEALPQDPPRPVKGATGGSKKKRGLADLFDILEAREFVGFLSCGSGTSKAVNTATRRVGQEAAQTVAQLAGQKAASQATAYNTPLSDDQKKAVQKMTGGTSQQVMQAVTAGASWKPPQKKKRDLTGLFDIRLEARHVEELVELLARGSGTSTVVNTAARRVGQEAAQTVAQLAGQKAASQATAHNTPLSDDQKKAVQKMTGGTSQQVVQVGTAGASGKPPQMKCGLEDIEDWLSARSGLYGDLEELD